MRYRKNLTHEILFFLFTSTKYITPKQNTKEEIKGYDVIILTEGIFVISSPRYFYQVAHIAPTPPDLHVHSNPSPLFLIFFFLFTPPHGRPIEGPIFPPPPIVITKSNLYHSTMSIIGGSKYSHKLLKWRC